MKTIGEEWAVSPDPDAIVTLRDFSALLEAFFDLPRGSVPQTAPYVWWKRSRDNLDISVPMPQAEVYLAEKAGWTQAAIIHWYAAWKRLEVPVCREAGDRVNSRGTTIPSKWRGAWTNG